MKTPSLFQLADAMAIRVLFTDRPVVHIRLPPNRKKERRNQDRLPDPRKRAHQNSTRPDAPSRGRGQVTASEVQEPEGSGLRFPAEQKLVLTHKIGFLLVAIYATFAKLFQMDVSKLDL